MSKNTVGEIVSRLRKQLKSVRQDAFLTDRFIYSVLHKHAKHFIKREDGHNKIMMQRGLFKSVTVGLEEVDTTIDLCSEVTSCEYITRTRDRVADLMISGYYCPLIYAIMSIDGSRSLTETTPLDYQNITTLSNSRLNKTGYYWISDGYIYFPNIRWKQVRVMGLPDEDVSRYYCSEQEKCKSRQELSYNVPSYLLGEIEGAALKELLVRLNIPADTTADNQHISR